MDLGGAFSIFSVYVGLSSCRILCSFTLFFLRPLPYEVLTQLIDEASEGDISISILTQVSRSIKPNLVIDILTLFSIDLAIDYKTDLVMPGLFLSISIPCTGNNGISSHVYANSAWPLC